MFFTKYIFDAGVDFFLSKNIRFHIKDHFVFLMQLSVNFRLFLYAQLTGGTEPLTLTICSIITLKIITFIPNTTDKVWNVTDKVFIISYLLTKTDITFVLHMG